VARLASYRELDWFLLVCALLICLLSVSEIYSTTQASPRFSSMHLRQMLWIGFGLAAMFLLARVDYHTLLEHALWIYLVALAGLVAVLLIGKEMFGARRWLEIGGINFQVSEAAKLAIILVLARYLSEVRTERLRFGDLLKVGLLTVVAMVLIAAQPDLGTALTLVPIVATGVFLAGLRWKHVAVLVLVGLLVLPAGWYLLRPYQRERLVTFLNPWQSPRGAGYQTLQSQIAIGSGGFWGKGMGKGSQNQLGFIPVRHAEFIMAAYAEEQGFAGVLLGLLLYLTLLLRLVYNAETALDRAGTFIVAGVASLLLFHLLVNVGMVIGIMPVTGIPLPLMSYGGSATISTWMALGLVMSVRMRRFVNL